ncbi:MAG: T9SS type A sorting domain-containing protein [Chlorobi bacterium]|nr:T9SS type A sorting domain-containing protein [Chlorobiota bacterium]
MKRRILGIGLVITALFISGSVFYFLLDKGSDSLIEKVKREEAEKEKYEWGRSKDYWLPRLANPETKKIDYVEITKIRREALRKGALRANMALDWVNLGPTNQGGRTRAILIDPNDPNKIIIGAASGGVWYSENGGQSWQPARGLTNLNISSLTMDPNTGWIYAGTGEYFAATDNLNSLAFTGNTGSAGYGIFVSKDGGKTFEHLASTTPGSYGSFNDKWSFVNDIEIAPSGRIYAGTIRGLVYSDDQGATWTDVNGAPTNAIVFDVEILSSGKVLAAIGGSVYESTDGVNFNQVDGSTGLDLPSANKVGRIRIASNGNVVYIVVIENQFYGGPLYAVYRSDDGGNTWYVIGDGTRSDGKPTLEFEPFCYLEQNGNPRHCQGVYDMALGVSPHDPDLVFLGGIFLFRWTPNEGWIEATGDIFALHVDHHDVAFHPKADSIVYVVNDGGVWISYDYGRTFYEINKNYVTTQFYAFDVNALTATPSGGTQDNGTQFLPYIAFSPGLGFHIGGGDGGYSAFAPKRGVIFYSSQFGCFLKGRIDQATQFGLAGTPIGNDENGCIAGASFIHPLRVWEDVSSDVPDTFYFARLRIVTSPQELDSFLNNFRILTYKVYDVDTDTDSVSVLYLEGEPMAGPRIIAVTSSSNKVTLSKTVAEPVLPLVWYQHNASIVGSTNDIAISNDGECAYFVTGLFSVGKVVRVCGLKDAKFGEIYNCTFDELDECVSTDINCLDNYSCSFNFSQAGIKVGVIFNTTRALVGIGFDPSDPRRMVVTGGGYGGASPRVWYTLNSREPSPTFIDITGDLPNIPVYDAFVWPDDSSKVTIATDLGIWHGTVDFNNPSNTIWTMDTLFPPVPTIMFDVIPHPTKPGEFAYFVATHGRGFWAYNFTPQQVITGVEHVPSVLTGITMFPNPASKYVDVIVPPASSDVKIAIYDLNGRAMLTKRVMPSSESVRHRISLDQFTSGVYIVVVEADGTQQVGRLVIEK